MPFYTIYGLVGKCTFSPPYFSKIVFRSSLETPGSTATFWKGSGGLPLPPPSRLGLLLLLLQFLKSTALGRAVYSEGIVEISMVQTPYGSKGLVRTGLAD